MTETYERNKPNDIEYLSAKDLAKMLSIGQSTVWQWYGQGKLPQNYKISGKCTRWIKSEVLEAVDKMTTRAEPCEDRKSINNTGDSVVSLNHG